LDKVYTVKEVAEILKVSEQTVQEALKKGQLPGAKVGRQWRITETSLTNYLNGNTGNDNQDEPR